MCGIASIIELTPTGEDLRAPMESMVDTMRYRGPDARGVYVEPQLGALGHARLSIIDVAAVSNQPFRLKSTRLHLTFNGEIFNYIELREKLKHDHGRTFETDSDTEVLLVAYDVWGDQCVDHFNGQWAFVIFDPDRNRVFCSRDRFGIKPFLYAQRGNQLLVASEAKSILKVAPQFRQPNFDALSLLLRASIGGQNHETCFEGIYRLPAAHNLVVEQGQFRIKRYWDYPTERSTLSYGDATDRLGELIDDAVRLRLRSDVEFGFTVSGGVDSCGIVSTARQFMSGSANAYTFGYEHPTYRNDETADARRICEQNGFNHVVVDLKPTDVLPILKQAIYHLEAPHAAVPIIPYWKIMEEARKSLTVVLEGQGADELLGGYVDRNAYPAMLDDLFGMRPYQALKKLGYGVRGRLGCSGTRFLATIVRGIAPWTHGVFRRWRGDEQVYLNELRNASSTFEFPRTRLPGYDRLNNELLRQHENGLVNLLQYSDAIPMAHSLEARVPFLDYRIVELGFQLPGQFKFRDAFGKAILRDSLHGKVPESILRNRVKRGFDTPIAHWFRERPREIIDPILRTDACRQRGLFDYDQMWKLIDAHCAGKLNIFSQIFRWMITEAWFQTFVDNEKIEPIA
ncbi:MAG: asparagine synthase (glutamine-hydrolyzing) [Planctomycetota bacterium]